MKTSAASKALARKNAILGIILAACAFLLATSVFVWQLAHRQPASTYQSETGE